MSKNVSLACFGAGEKSKYVRSLILQFSSNSVLYYIENQIFNKIGLNYDGLEVISIYKLKQLYENGKLGGVVISTAYHKRTVQEMIKTCIKLGIKDENIYLVKNKTLVTGHSNENELLVPYKECIQIYNLEIHLVDHCNMNCELCCHNSQLVEGEVFTEFDEYCKDLNRLKELIPDICQISLLGGEPLLHPELFKFLDYTRQVYPYTKIVLVTNGLLLKKSSLELLECFKRNQINISISLYPPMHYQLDKLLEYIKRMGLNARVNYVDRFFKKFCEIPQFDPQEMSSYCGYCMGLRNGKISRCIDSLYIDYFNKKFGNIFPETAGFDIYDKDITSIELIHRLEQPLELCAYCAAKYTLVDNFEWRKVSKNIRKQDILLEVKGEYTVEEKNTI